MEYVADVNFAVRLKFKLPRRQRRKSILTFGSAFFTANSASAKLIICQKKFVLNFGIRAAGQTLDKKPGCKVLNLDHKLLKMPILCSALNNKALLRTMVSPGGGQNMRRSNILILSRTASSAAIFRSQTFLRHSFSPGISVSMSNNLHTCIIVTFQLLI